MHVRTLRSRENSLNSKKGLQGGEGGGGWRKLQKSEENKYDFWTLYQFSDLLGTSKKLFRAKEYKLSYFSLAYLSFVY